LGRDLTRKLSWVAGPELSPRWQGRQLREVPVGMEQNFVGLDVHARSVVACGLDDVTGELSEARLVPDNETVLAWLRALAVPVAVV